VAGFELIDEIQKKNPDVSILVYSARSENEAHAEELGLRYIDKKSKHLQKLPA